MLATKLTLPIAVLAPIVTGILGISGVWFTAQTRLNDVQTSVTANTASISKLNDGKAEHQERLRAIEIELKYQSKALDRIETKLGTARGR